MTTTSRYAEARRSARRAALAAGRAGSEAEWGRGDALCNRQSEESLTVEQRLRRAGLHLARAGFTLYRVEGFGSHVVGGWRWYHEQLRSDPGLGRLHDREAFREAEAERGLHMLRSAGWHAANEGRPREWADARGPYVLKGYDAAARPKPLPRRPKWSRVEVGFSDGAPSAVHERPVCVVRNMTYGVVRVVLDCGDVVCYPSERVASWRLTAAPAS